jgi:hypothetical protein
MNKQQCYWTQENESKLKTYIASVKTKNSVAVFDFDNTCIYGDCGDEFYFHVIRSGFLSVEKVISDDQF